MKQQVLNTDGAMTPPFGFSQGIQVGDQIWVCGQIGADPKTGSPVGDDIESQTRQAIASLEAVLQAGGASLADLVMVHVYLDSLTHFKRFDEIYREMMPQPWPARATISVALYPWMVEIAGVAMKGSGTQPI